MVTDGKWGYVPLGPQGGEELFDLEADPLAGRNRIRGGRRQADALREALHAHLAELDAPPAVWALLETGGR